MKKIEDYIHFYIGQSCVTTMRAYRPEGGKSYKRSGRIMEIDLVISQVGVHFEGEAITDLVNFPFNEVKLILRSLSSMTEEDGVKLFKSLWPHDDSTTDKGMVECMNYILDNELDIVWDWMEDKRVSLERPYRMAEVTKELCDLGFDVFRLIPEGLAVEQDK